MEKIILNSIYGKFAADRVNVSRGTCEKCGTFTLINSVNVLTKEIMYSMCANKKHYGGNE